MKIVSSEDRDFRQVLARVAQRTNPQGAGVERVVKTILRAVERGGDAAVSRYTKKFDGVTLKPAQFRVTADEIKEAYHHIRKEEGDALRLAADRIRQFHERQRLRTWTYQDGGATLGQMVLPLDAVGLYVPGGKALYPSSVLMAAVPAKVAGVPRVMMCTPSQTAGISPYLLVAADIGDVNEIYRIGGVQAIGAMAYGTGTIPRVDKIVGPGNIYVATAKRFVYGTVDIDMIAGPSELLVVADQAANAAHVAADLLCEAEHDEEAKVWLVTTSRRVAQEVSRRLEEQVARLLRTKIARGAVARHAVAFVVPSLEEAIDVANQIAPEHLSLSIDRPFEHLEKFRHAGAVFVGRSTPPAIADYVAGPNHVLPTGGSARFFSALSLDDYVRKTNIIAYSQEALVRVKDQVLRLATMEGLDAHAKSVESRLS